MSDDDEAAILEMLLTSASYDSVEEAIAACRALSAPGDEIAIHDGACEIDDEGDGCTCEPIVVVAGERVMA